MKRFLPSLFSLALILSSAEAWAAACCGGGFAAPSLIAGDDKAMLTATYGYSRIVDDVGADTLWRPRESNENSTTYKIEAAHVFADRWQAGLQVPVVERERAAAHSTGLGDIAGTVGYEYLPDWDYSPWRPKGIGFLQLTAPSGRSISESEAAYQLDARGRGFWAIGLGTLLTKAIGRYDFFLNTDVHRSFDKAYANSQSSGRLHPGYGGNLALGAGYNLADWRFGGSLTWTYEDPIDVTGTATSDGAAQRFATAALAVSRVWHDEWAVTLSYSDQTWFGSPVNTTLGRGASLIVQRRWPR